MTQRLTMLAMCAASLLGLAYIATSFAQERETASSNWKDLKIQYASANLQLAQARLAIAQQENEQLADSVTGEAMASLQAGVVLAQGRLNDLQGAGDGNEYAACIASAQALLNGAEQKLKESQQANSLDANAVPAGIMQREQAEIEVAKARLAMLKVLHEQPAEEQLRWELRQLQDEVRALWNRPLIRN